MGEYARLYTLEQFGVDIGDDEDSDMRRYAAMKKWTCRLCSKNLGSERANKDHMRDKHGITAQLTGSNDKADIVRQMAAITPRQEFYDAADKENAR